MTTIITLTSGQNGASSLSDINANYVALNAGKIETSVLDTDTSLTANSDSKIATQKATKAYVDNIANSSEVARGLVEEATDAEVTAGTSTGGTGAKLFITPTKLSTYLASTTYIGQVASGVTSKSFADANGSQTTIAHGLTKNPKISRITCVYSDGTTGSSTQRSSYAYAVYSASTQSAIHSYQQGGNSATSFSSAHGNSFRVYEQKNSGNTYYFDGTITTDATNIHITWSKVGTPTGTFYLTWEALT